MGQSEIVCSSERALLKCLITPEKDLGAVPYMGTASLYSR